MSYNKSIDEAIDSSWLMSIAYYISAIFSPPLVLSYGVILCAYASNIPSIFYWTGLFLVLFLLFPLCYTIYLMKKGLISDFHMASRKERIIPLIVDF